MTLQPPPEINTEELPAPIEPIPTEIAEGEPAYAEVEEPILTEENASPGPIRSGLYWIGDTISGFFNRLFGK